MASTNKLNPGLGFRPQIDPEDFLIYYKKDQGDESKVKLLRNLQIFLNKYYDQKLDMGNPILNCQNQNLDSLREQFASSQSYCQYDYESVLQGTSCDPHSEFGYSSGPCVLLKLNKIFDWIPKPYEKLESFPLNPSLIQNNTAILNNNVIVQCDGEYGADTDALNLADIKYYSQNTKDTGINGVGLLPYYYYPYLNQPGYKSPLIFIHFQNLPHYRLINVVCRAYAANIDSDDKLNLRGMVKFQLFIDK
jgi:sodium/potassium-transporting ATPase subunit beta